MTTLVCTLCATPIPAVDARCPACGNDQATRAAPHRPRLMKHARAAASARRWHWGWRRLHALSNCRDDEGPFWRRDEYTLDTGYCLDRYTIDDQKKEPQ